MTLTNTNLRLWGDQLPSDLLNPVLSTTPATDAPRIALYELWTFTAPTASELQTPVHRRSQRGMAACSPAASDVLSQETVV